jgi:hypothetical protein
LPQNYERCLANTLLYCSRSRYQECQKNPRAKWLFFFTGSIIEECPKMFHEHTTVASSLSALSDACEYEVIYALNQATRTVVFVFAKSR